MSYRLLIKVKQISKSFLKALQKFLDEICGIAIPIFIGSVPHSTCHNKNKYMRPELQQSEEERRPHYQRDLSERPCSLFEANETYLSKLNRMLHINTFPYFPQMVTSAKKSCQFKMLASAVRAENM